MNANLREFKKHYKDFVDIFEKYTGWLSLLVLLANKITMACRL